MINSLVLMKLIFETNEITTKMISILRNEMFSNGKIYELIQFMNNILY